MLCRRRFILSALAIASPALAQAKVPVITVLGDSITAGLGLSAKEALPAQLALALQRLGVTATVRAAGVSGDTSAGGLDRADFSVEPDTTVCVIELGANDYLQSVPPAEIRANLTTLITKLRQRGIVVVLAASRAPRAASGAYGRAFNSVFADAAKAGGATLAQDLLLGILDRPELRQPDGVHPNSAGVALMAVRLAPVIAHALKRTPRRPTLRVGR